MMGNLVPPPPPHKYPARRTLHVDQYDTPSPNRATPQWGEKNTRRMQRRERGERASYFRVLM